VTAIYLSAHHRTTLDRLDRNPTSHNIEWNDVVGLLREVGPVDEQHDGKVKVTVGQDTIVISPPRGKDLDEDLVLLLRRTLGSAGCTTEEAGAA
jgi:hypothetical protein